MSVTKREAGVRVTDESEAMLMTEVGAKVVELTAPIEMADEFVKLLKTK